MMTNEQAIHELTERIKEVRSAQGNLTTTENAILITARASSSLLGAMVRLADQWPLVEQVLDRIQREAE